MRRVLIVLVGCGRVAFDPLGAPGDATSNAAGGPNRAFVTSQLFTGDLGGLAGADAKCMAAANSVGMTGAFVALVADMTTSTIDDRLLGSSGWVRTDGLPLFDDPSSAAFANLMYNPLDLDERRNVVVEDLGVFTGGTGSGGTMNCASWHDGTADTSGLIGLQTSGGLAFVSLFGASTCDVPHHLYCVETGRSVSVRPAGPALGRRIFVSNVGLPSGVAASDAQCQADADAASLGGTFLAALATTTSTIASRFTDDARPIVRLDGTLVASSISELMTGADVRSFANESTSSYLQVFVWTGAQDPQSLATPSSSCNNWTTTSATVHGLAGNPLFVTSPFWSGALLSCNTTAFVLCIQQ